ncbi:MAG: MATE family efflux transporter [Christensenellales bacterium]|jgi:putative MATE family efflux protein
MTQGRGLLNDREFYKNMLRIALPIAAQNLLSSSAHLIDTIMVGALGETALSAVGMAGQWSFFMFLFLFGFSSGSSVFFSQYWGARDMPRIRHTFTLGMMNILLITMLFMMVGLAAPAFVLRVFTPDEAVVELGVRYLRVVAWGYLASALNVYAGALLRSVEQVKLTVFANVTAVAVNTFFNWVLIFGKFGAPAMGVEGAAWATVLSSWVCTLILYGVSLRDRNILVMAHKKFFRVRLSTLKRFYPVVLPVVLNESIWALAVIVMNMVYGRLGTGNYAAMTVKNTIENLTFTFFVGLSSACTVMVGKRIGAGQIREGHKDAQRFGLLAPLLAVVTGGLLILFRGTLTGLFDLNPEVRQTAQTLLIISSCIYPLRMFNHMNIVGTFRAGGDTRASLFIDAGGVWLCSVPLVAVTGMLLKLPFIWVYSMTAAEEMVKFVLGVWYLRSGRWIKPVTVPAVPATESEVRNENQA